MKRNHQSKLGSILPGRLSVRGTRLPGAIWCAAAGLLPLWATQAQANISLFTTTSDFTGWTAGTATPAASTLWDSDGSTTNGAGNDPGNSGASINVGGTSTAGSLQLTASSSLGYNFAALSPGEAFNTAFMTAIDPGSIAAYTAASGYGSGTLVSYSGTMLMTYTIPTISSGSYFQVGVYFNDAPDGYYHPQFASGSVSDGTVDGLTTYTATIPYTLNAGSFNNLNLGFFTNSNYVPSSPFYVDAIQEVTAVVTGPVSANWVTNGNGNWEDNVNWNPGEPAVAGSTATFDSDGGTITVNPTVTLSSPVTIDSLTFNTSSVSYTIANGGGGNIKTNNINVFAGTHTINTALSTGAGTVFNISSGASLTAINVVDTVGFYHSVTLTGGGSLTVNALNHAALNDYGVALTTTAGNTGQFVFLAQGAVWNIDATSTIEQFYDDASDTLNLGPGVTLYTEQNTDQIEGTLTGSGNLSLGGGANGFTSGSVASLSGNNANYSGAVTITGTGTLTITRDANLGNGSSSNTLTLDNGTLNLSGGVTGTHSLIINAGNGTINTGGFNMQVASVTGVGTLTLAGGNTLAVSPEVVAANSSGGIRTLALGGLNLSTSNLTLSSSALTKNRSVLALGSGGLSLSGSTNSWTSTLDLGNNDLIVQNGSISTVANQLHQGYAGGTWQGSGGILSGAAAADTTHLTTLGAIPNTVNGTTSIYSTFDGVAVGTSAVLVKYTYYGDANLDGRVDGSDYSLIDNGYNQGLTGWLNGDFNGDGVVDGSDYSLIDNAYLSQGSQISAELASPTAQIAGGGATAAVPEPASLGLTAIGAVGLLARRKNRRHG